MLKQSEIKRKIAGIRTSSKAIRDNIQVVLVNIAGHVYEHGDVSMYDDLFEATSGINRKRIAHWAQKHGFAKLTANGFKLNKSARENAQFNNGVVCTAYLENHAPKWYENEEGVEQVAKAVNVAARIESITSQIKKGAKDFEVDTVAIKEAFDGLMDAISDRTTEQLKDAEALLLA